VTCLQGPEGKCIHSSSLSLTSTLDASWWLRPRSAALPPGMTRYLLYRKLGGPQGQSGRGQRISSLPGFDLRILQRVANRYTDSPIPAHPSLVGELLTCREICSMYEYLVGFISCLVG
jgi:hypothetical protein